MKSRYITFVVTNPVVSSSWLHCLNNCDFRWLICDHAKEEGQKKHRHILIEFPSYSVAHRFCVEHEHTNFQTLYNPRAWIDHMEEHGQVLGNYEWGQYYK